MKRRTSAFTTLLAPALLIPLSASAEVRLPAVFSDHMVLQRDVPLPVWGWANPGETVTVQLGGKSATAVANPKGEWKASLPPQKVGAPLTLTVSGSSTVTRQDVLIGEVWVCSGQSNMEMSVSMSSNAQAELADSANYPDVRILLVPRKVSDRPEDDVVAQWKLPTPQTLTEGGWNGFSAAAWSFGREIHGKLKVPVGLIESSWGGTRIEPWTPPEGFAAVPEVAEIWDKLQPSLPSSPLHKKALEETLAANEKWQKECREAMAAGTFPPRPPAVPADLWMTVNEAAPTALYNAMIHPLLSYPIRGALWYQGESNLHDGAAYTAKMKALIGGWRQLWKQGDFPFYYVQIAPYQYEPNAEAEPALMEAQTAALSIPNTGMVVTNDIGNLHDIHPANKKEVGHRLALLALARTYGEKNLVDGGPLFKAMQIEGGHLRLTFDSVGGGLASRDGKPLNNFEIIDAEKGGFVPAEARIEGNSILLTSPAVPHPIAMRFAWNQSAEPNFMNKEGLPAGPFRAGDLAVRSMLNLPEAKGYLPVYDLDISKPGPTPAYDGDYHARVKGPFDRIAYYLELGDGTTTQYLFVSMDAFTSDITKIGVPTAESGGFFQQNVNNLVVATNAPGIASGPRPVGNIEFWPGNYEQGNSANVPGASSQTYDFGDKPTTPIGYGSMQVHDFNAKQTLFAYNNWRLNDSKVPDVGIGNCPGQNPDWTFARNGDKYPVKRLRVFVHPGQATGK